MIFQLNDLCLGTSRLLPEKCRTCGWWQGHDDGGPAATAAAAWAHAAEESFGRWGKLALDDGRLLGMLQFGPAGLFPRSRKLACGPPGGDSVLITCSSVSSPELEPVRKSLLLAAVTELEGDGVETIEAFCRTAPAERGDCHLLDEGFLKSCGFYPVKSSRRLRLMRLELAGLQPVKYRSRKSRLKILGRIKRAAPSPTPVTLCKAEPRGKAKAAMPL